MPRAEYWALIDGRFYSFLHRFFFSIDKQQVVNTAPVILPLSK
jgi:hypothetical protein